MASAFNVELSIPHPPGDVQARAADALKDPARAVGLRLTGRGPNELRYRPRVQFPFLLMLWHTLSGERMTVSFAPAEGAAAGVGESGAAGAGPGPDRGTLVRISGAVARSAQPLASDPEHWSAALSGSGEP